MYKIIVDRSHALVKIEMEGMLSVAEADALVGDLIRQITEARLASYGLIIDVSRCPVQAQGTFVVTHKPCSSSRSVPPIVQVPRDGRSARNLETRNSRRHENRHSASSAQPRMESSPKASIAYHSMHYCRVQSTIHRR